MNHEEMQTLMQRIRENNDRTIHEFKRIDQTVTLRRAPYLMGQCWEIDVPSAFIVIPDDDSMRLEHECIISEKTRTVVSFAIWELV